MDSYKLAVKLFVQDASGLTGHEFVPIFHSWIQQKKLSDHLVIDVADYEHVHHGPGTMIVTFEANFATDHEDGQTGLLYIRKQPIPRSTFSQRLIAVIRPVLQAAQWLEQDPLLAGKVKFRRMNYSCESTIAFRRIRLRHFQISRRSHDRCDRSLRRMPLEMKTNPLLESLFEVRIKTPGSRTLADPTAKH